MKNLAKCKFGCVYTIQQLDKSAPLKTRRRLCDLGFTVGQKVKLIRKSLLGKAFLLEIRGYTLSIRSTIAEAVIVE